jgi:hypothetical protein
MGLEQSITFSQGVVPRWAEVNELLDRREFRVQVRMIDGELALPDEAVPDHWRELRVSTPSGMVTLKRQGDRVVCTAWSNADDKLKQAWNALAWSFAQVGDGRVMSPAGKYSPDEFYRVSELPNCIKKPAKARG